MWRAKLKSVSENSVPNDSLQIDITFFNDSKEFTKTYSFESVFLQDKQQLLDFVAAEINKLNKMDETIVSLQDLIDKEL